MGLAGDFFVSSSRLASLTSIEKQIDFSKNRENLLAHQQNEFICNFLRCLFVFLSQWFLLFEKQIEETINDDCKFGGANAMTSRQSASWLASESHRGYKLKEFIQSLRLSEELWAATSIAFDPGKIKHIWPQLGYKPHLCGDFSSLISSKHKKWQHEKNSLLVPQ